MQCAWTLGIILRYVLAPSSCSNELRETIVEQWEELATRHVYTAVSESGDVVSLRWPDLKLARLCTVEICKVRNITGVFVRVLQISYNG